VQHNGTHVHELAMDKELLLIHDLRARLLADLSHMDLSAVDAAFLTTTFAP
jgi:hypothetical protein